MAGRWHLFEDPSAAMLEAVRKSMPNIRVALGVTVIDPSQMTAAERRQHNGFLRRQATATTPGRLLFDNRFGQRPRRQPAKVRQDQCVDTVMTEPDGLACHLDQFVWTIQHIQAPV